MITKEMKVSELLERYPELLPVLAGYHPHFGRLKNRVLRKLMAPRVTLEQAARMAGVDLADLLLTLKKSLGGVPCHGEGNGTGTAGYPPGGCPRAPSSPKPEILERLDPARVVLLDVREDLRRGEEPFAKIMKRIKALRPEQVLLLRVPFEPIPLYEVLRPMGFSGWAQADGPEDWRVYFYRDGTRVADSSGRVAAGPAEGGEVTSDEVTIDVRGLQPPQPMERILSALNRLQGDQRLLVIHERRPMFLLPRLEERGYSYEINEEGAGKVILRIWKPVS
ncbi:MAG: DUF2249 domain-containing protein [Candidatus Tectomicrobia bacterium]|uniref:DUF2249 domain-containing protein n=1 Tax=Tectimicrobiota bacterium TaxID=2528274 RepID=A0A932GRS4_UNCTE|nr:DUF2249 domain-containing protein [Candidatus Tectomicrobia bacterium]